MRIGRERLQQILRGHGISDSPRGRAGAGPTGLRRDLAPTCRAVLDGGAWRLRLAAAGVVRGGPRIGGEGLGMSLGP